MRDEGGSKIRLDLCGPEGIIGSVTVERSLLPLLAHRLLEAGIRGSQIAVEGPEAHRQPNGVAEGKWPSEAVRVAYEVYLTGRAEEAMQRDKFKDLFKRKGGKRGR